MLTDAGGQPGQVLLAEVALLMGIDEAFVEKDWFVTDIIRRLVQQPYAGLDLVFTGGTSLSKAHKLIERFSEDIDFRIVGPGLAGQSASAIRKTLSGFRQHLVGVLSAEYVMLSAEGRDGNQYIQINVAYPTLFGVSPPLRPHIKLDCVVDSLQLPGLLLPVSSFVNEATQNAPEVAQIVCTDPVENAADKLSALTWRIPARTRGVNDRHPDLVRHLYDLAKLGSRALSSPDFARIAQLTLDRDTSREPGQADLTTAARLQRLLTILTTDPVYPVEYNTFVHGMSYAPDAAVPAYSEAVATIEHLTAYISI